jgi:hypothetical protein
MKSLFSLFFLFMYSSSLYAAILLKHGMADPDAIVLGEYIYFSGTYGNQETIDVYRMRVGDFIREYHTDSPNLADLASLYKTYNPREEIRQLYGSRHAHRYCAIWGPNFTMHENELLISFTSTFVPNTSESCSSIMRTKYTKTIEPASFYSTNFGPPLFYSFPDIGINSSTRISTSRNNIKIDSDMVVDTRGDSWFLYTWFIGSGNANSAINLENMSVKDMTYPNYNFDEGITEAPSIFYRNGWYYLLFSENNYNSKYQMYYKKGRSIENINTNTPACRLTFNSWHTAPTDTSYGYNAGAGSVISVNGEYYMVYHIGKGNKTNFSRSSYVTKLEFFPSGNIKQIPAPDFVGGGNQYLGSFSHCY